MSTSEGVKTAEEKAAEARRGPRRTGGPPHMAMGMPAEKSISFGPSARRLLGWLAPERLKVTTVIAVSYTHLDVYKRQPEPHSGSANSWHWSSRWSCSSSTHRPLRSCGSALTGCCLLYTSRCV